MPEYPNPYLDPMNPGGYVPNYGQPGYLDDGNPYMQQGAWNQGQYGNPMDYGAQPPYYDSYMSPDSMMSAQDIYANQAAAMGGMGGYGMPYADPNAAYMDPAFGQYGQDMYGQSMPGYGYEQQFYPEQMPMAQPVQMPQVPGYPYGQTGGFEPVQPQMDPTFGRHGVGPLPSESGPIPIATAEAIAQAAHAQQPPIPQTTGQQPPIPQTTGQQPAQQPQQAQQPQPQQPQQAASQTAQGKQDAQGQKASQRKKKRSSKSAKNQGPQLQVLQQSPQGQPQPQAAPQVPQVPRQPINPAKAKKGRATLALILGIFSIIFALISPLGLVLSLISIKLSNSYRRNGGRAGSADAAKVFGVVGFIFSIAMLIILIMFIGYVMGQNEMVVGILKPTEFYNNSPIGHIIPVPTGK